MLALVPVAIDAGSLDLASIARDQAEPLRPIAWLAARPGGPAWLADAARWSLPSWNLFVQPLTALLVALSLSLWIASPEVEVRAKGSIGLAGAGLDGDTADRYWLRLDAGLARVLGAALFVTLFLGAGDVPFVDAARLLDFAEPRLGRAVPRIGWAALETGCFAAKLLAVLAVGLRVGRVVADARDDRSLRLATRRLAPLAWANLLLVAGLSLWLAERAAEHAS